jgi:hypothetical protein
MISVHEGARGDARGASPLLRRGLRHLAEKPFEVPAEQSPYVLVQARENDLVSHRAGIPDERLGESGEPRVGLSSRTFRTSGVPHGIAQRETGGERAEAPDERILRRVVLPVDQLVEGLLHGAETLSGRLLDFRDMVDGWTRATHR